MTSFITVKECVHCAVRAASLNVIQANFQYLYDYVTKLVRHQTEVLQNHVNENVCNIGQGEARHRKYKRLKRGGQAYYRSSD